MSLFYPAIIPEGNRTPYRPPAKNAAHINFQAMLGKNKEPIAAAAIRI
jgi:hypothetical protein